MIGSRSVLTADEWVAISNLYAQCNLAGDRGGADEYADCYLSDGVLSLDGLVIASGRVQLVELIRHHEMDRADRFKRHITSNIHVVKTSSKAARGECYLIVLREGPNGEAVLTDVGRFEDELQLKDGRWGFASRSLSLDFSLPEFMPALPR